MTSLQQQARALGDPTRHAIYEHIGRAATPVSVAELTKAFGFNHNAIRQHLAKLVGAGLVTETQARADGPGRPRLLYAVAPTAQSRWGTVGSYEHLSWLLADAAAGTRTPREVGRAAAAELRPAAPSDDPVDDVVAAMARQGFDPEVRTADDGGTEIVLRSCAFESTAARSRDVVCQLHLGLAEGLAAGTDIVVDELVGYHPEAAHCRLRLRARGADEATAAPEAALSLRRRPAR